MPPHFHLRWLFFNRHHILSKKAFFILLVD